VIWGTMLDLLSLANRRFKFKERGQLFIRSHNEALTVASVRVSNPDRAPGTIHEQR
jgi:hypothetical protein